jgi:putative ABC transport system ATP-binding protein
MRIEGIQLGLQYMVSGAEAFSDITIRLLDTGIYAVTGPSGCGKSSLLYVLSGLCRPTAGTLYFDDIDVNGIANHELFGLRKKRFGFIFQKHFLIGTLSVLDNILVPLNTKDEKSIVLANELMQRFELSGMEARKPYELSHGQRQLVAVARAFINSPQVIFADEPTAALDAESTRMVMDFLKEKSLHASILLISHDLCVLESANQIFRMENGRINPIHDNCHESL